MDSMSYRNNRPAQRQTEASVAPVRQPAAPVASTTSPSPRANRSPDDKKSKTKRVVLLISLITVLTVLAIAGWAMLGRDKGVASAIDSNKYQAIFFENGQVYFGKLQQFGDDYFKLSDIYYLQAQSDTEDKSENPQKAKSADTKSDVQLIKLGDEVHGPEDQMVINKDQLLFYENLKVDGKVAQSIKKFQAAKN